MTAELVAHVAAGLLLVMLGAVIAFCVIAKAFARAFLKLRNQARGNPKGYAETKCGPIGLLWFRESPSGEWVLVFEKHPK